MMSMLPCGANILLSSISSSIVNKFPLGRPDYIISSKEISTITYSYIEKNGTLVGIDTNLILSNWDKVNKTFTISNSNIFGTDTEPYINLQCNNVKIPISFLDHSGSGNKWYETDSTTYSNKIRLKGYYNPTHVDIIKYYTINWDTPITQQIFIEKNTSGGNVQSEYYACDAFYDYLDNNNNIQHGQSTVYTIQGQAPNGYVTIPKLNGETDSLKNGNNIITTKKFINYFALGVQVHINDGYSIYKADTQTYITGTNEIYSNTGFPDNISNKKYLENEHGIPLRNDNLRTKWNNNFFYKTQNENYYISPATSEIYYDWDILSTCISYCGADSPGGDDNSAGTVKTYWICKGLYGDYYWNSPEDARNTDSGNVAGRYYGDDTAEAYDRAPYYGNHYLYQIGNIWMADNNMSSTPEEKTKIIPGECGCSANYCTCDGEDYCGCDGFCLALSPNDCSCNSVCPIYHNQQLCPYNEERRDSWGYC